MPNVQEFYLRGDQIATFQSVASSGNSNGVKVTLGGVQTLGASTTYFRVVVRQIGSGQDALTNGQFIDIYAHPPSTPPGPPLFSNLNPQHDMYQGRASSSEHQIITNPAQILIQTAPITNGTVQIGPGIKPLRTEQLQFDSLPATPPVIPCFVAGTLIRTARGEVPVEMIRADDRVQTLDNGYQPVVWAGQRRVCGLGSMAPVRFRAGSVGNRRRLLVSPQHRMLVSGWRSELASGEVETLAAAVHLINGGTISRKRCPFVTYVHLLFESHQVLLAEGSASESLFPGSQAFSAFDRAARAEITRLFPRLCPVKGTGSGMARPVLSRAAAQMAFA